MREELKKTVKRLVIKVGTHLLIKQGKLNRNFIQHLADQIAMLRDQGITCLLVSSGSVGCGVYALGKQRKPDSLPEQQAAAAIGQSRLMRAYDEIFEAKGMLSAQILITQEDLQDRVRYLNASNTLSALLKAGAVPIINENDTVVVDEICFGDNDYLAALITNVVRADLLVILSSVPGLMNMQTGQVVSCVKRIDQSILALVKPQKTRFGTGGMETKLTAARLVMGSGDVMVLAAGNKKNILLDIMAGKDVGTLFWPPDTKRTNKKRWIAVVKKAKGKLVVDEGAKEAIVMRGKSLLASGIISVQETFKRGDMVVVFCAGVAIAKGLVNYDKDEIDQIKGLKTSEFNRVLGYKTYDEIIHRDNLVMLTEQGE